MPQPGSFIRSDSESIIRESPKSIFTRKKSLAEYRNEQTPKIESILLDQESVTAVEGPFISNRGSNMDIPVRSKSNLQSQIRVTSKQGLEDIIDDSLQF